MDTPPISEKPKEHLLKETDILLSVTNRKGIISSANNVFCDISGYSRKNLTGRPQNIVRHADMPKHIFRLMWDSIETGKSFGGYIKNKSKSGDPFWLFSLVFPIEGHYFAISMRAQSKVRDEIDDLYQKMRNSEKSSVLDSHYDLNMWLLAQGFNDYHSWMASVLEREMLNHPFFANILLENEAILKLSTGVDSSLHSITVEAISQMWASYVEFQRNFKNCILRMRECLYLMNRFQSLMMVMSHHDRPDLFAAKAQSKEFTTGSIHRMHLDFFFQSSRRLQFWYNSLILQSKLIDDIIVESIQNLSNQTRSQIDEMYDTLDLINIITENIAQIPSKLTEDYERVFQKTEAYLKLIDIENKPEILEQKGNDLRKQGITELKKCSEDFIKVYSRLCDDFEVDVHDFHQVVRSAFHIMLGPKRASS